MLERMAEFFEKRLCEYDEHMLTCIESAPEFYRLTANVLPKKKETEIIDLGCGTGLELTEYFAVNPTAVVTGIDISVGMLDELKRKFPSKNIKTVLGSYFEIPFGEEQFDAAVSVESLHHFTKEEKISLYKKLHASLKKGGYFILTDYFSMSEEEEIQHRSELLRLKKEQSAEEGVLYHYDTPLTVEHETEALIKAGFSSVHVLGSWGATFTLRADR
ncbi:MAG: class I SAM-dependent methyltransferase [Clostridia bacterium]|nr:class I SAM-dependent methyltransferase [Clostridia bacterium]